MRIKNTFITSFLLGAGIIAGATSMTSPKQTKPNNWSETTWSTRQERNLKVLPKNISDEALDKIMDEYTDALGVKCAYCHAPAKDKPSELDYASDAKGTKTTSRQMMTMTAAINQQFFKDHIDGNGKLSEAVSCITCHSGQEYPPSKK